MSHDEHDRWLDEQLRGVTAPRGLADRLARIAAPSDEELDAALRAVATPPGLLRSLALVTAPDDDQIDRWLADVEVPDELPSRLRRIAVRPRWRVGSLAAAACLCLLAGVSYAGVVAAFVWGSLHPRSAVSEPQLIAQWPAAFLAAEDYPHLVAESAEMVVVGASPRAAEPDQHALATPVGDWLAADIDESVQEPAGDERRTPSLGTLLGSAGVLFVSDQGWSLADSALARLADGVPADGLMDGPLGRLSRLDRAPSPMFLPKNSSAARNWQATRGSLPPLSVAEQPSLVIPATIRSTSYGMLRDAALASDVADRTLLRTEEVLAIAADSLPLAPDNRLVYVWMAAVRTPTSGDTHLVQIGLRVRELQPAAHRPRHLTIVIDTSRSMLWAERLSMTRRALVRLTESLGPRDRLTLVAFDEQARTLIANATRDDAAAWQSAVASLSAANRSNLPAGLIAGIAAANDVPADPAVERHLVLLTDNTTDATPDGLARAARALALPQSAGIELHVAQLAPPANRLPLDTQRLSPGASPARSVASAPELRWTLVEWLTGRQPIAGVEGQWSVTFNPRVVASYRLLGYEPVLVDAPADTPGVTIHGGQTMTALVEVRLTPEAQRGALQTVAARELARAEFTWKDPRTAAERRSTGRVLLGEVAATFADSPAALQFATQAAAAAEVLATTPDGAPERLAEIVGWASQARPSLAANSRYREFLDTLAALAEQGPARGGKR